jgi:hypothetical protein
MPNKLRHDLKLDETPVDSLFAALAQRRTFDEVPLVHGAECH